MTNNFHHVGSQKVNKFYRLPEMGTESSHTFVDKMKCKTESLSQIVHQVLRWKQMLHHLYLIYESYDPAPSAFLANNQMFNDDIPQL
jgi:hypothetical protein